MSDRTFAQRLIWRVGSWLPRSWRIELLRGLAWPEFVVGRQWLHVGPDGPEVQIIDVDEK